MNRNVWAIALLALAAGCSRQSGEEAGSVPSATPAATTLANAEPTAAPAPRAIPPALRGRWGLVAADCEPGRDDAKGLMVVAADGLTFYESRARLGPVRAAAPDRIRATFAFSGEGEEWSSDVELRSWEGGAKLIRQDRGPDSAGPLTYQRCPA